MQTTLSKQFIATEIGKEANEVLRKCVHCGFCNATCPTFQLFGNELDGPRGRIYHIKQLLEGELANQSMQTHLDRCLTCRACETTCPSGVQYSTLLEIGRQVMDKQRPRPMSHRIARKMVEKVIGHASIFSTFLKTGQLLKPVLPRYLKKKIPRQQKILSLPNSQHSRKMVALAGCAQPALTPATNVAAAKVLDKLGITLIEQPGAGCCGALALHTTSVDQAKTRARALIDIWLPLLDQGIEAFIISASGCGVTIKEYPHLFRYDSNYLAKANVIAENSFDLSEVVEQEISVDFPKIGLGIKVAFHSPCTLQHGQKITGRVENILHKIGYELLPVNDAHLCCGSAGTYSIFHPQISNQLKSQKIANLMKHQPDIICTANVGCQTHLEAGQEKEVKHWIELLVS